MKKTFLGLMAICTMFAFTSCKDKAAAGANEGGETTEVSGETGLEGTWEGDVSALMASAGEDIAKAFQNSTMIMKLDGSNITMDMDMNGTVEEGGMSITMGMKVNFEGPYTSTDNTITADYAKCTPKFDIYKLDIKGDEQTMAAMEAAGMGSEQMKQAMQEQMKPENLKEMVKDFNATIKYAMPDSKTLILTDEKGQEMKFTRK
ncbi:MAG: hypothetical protein MJZ60_07580 [Bacteroidaceae bacterium]|nr:hypothetical protein [Bacteroidaceae bacterium]